MVVTLVRSHLEACNKQPTTTHCNRHYDFYSHLARDILICQSSWYILDQ